LLLLGLSILTNCPGISISNREFPILGSGYKFDYDPVGDIAILKDKNMYIIDGNIMSYANDSKFIVLSERPRELIPECAGTMPNATYDGCNAAFDKSTFLQYWIINIKEKNDYIGYDFKRAKYSNVYGPFSEEEYLQKRKMLGVPTDLKLQDISNWKLH